MSCFFVLSTSFIFRIYHGVATQLNQVSECNRRGQIPYNRIRNPTTSLPIRTDALRRRTQMKGRSQSGPKEDNAEAHYVKASLTRPGIFMCQFIDSMKVRFAAAEKAGGTVSILKMECLLPSPNGSLPQESCFGKSFLAG